MYVHILYNVHIFIIIHDVATKQTFDIFLYGFFFSQVYMDFLGIYYTSASTRVSLYTHAEWRQCIILFYHTTSPWAHWIYIKYIYIIQFYAPCICRYLHYIYILYSVYNQGHIHSIIWCLRRRQWDFSMWWNSVW